MLELRDLNSREKDRKWSERKKKANEIASVMFESAKTNKSLKKRAQEIAACSSVLVFEECSVEENHKHLEHALFCQDRFCPICSWRKSLKTFSNNMKILEVLNKRYEKINYYMLTLTIQNCEVSKTKETISIMQKAWDRFSRRKKFKDSFLGYIKVLELTRNTKKYKNNNWYGTIHPHYHILLGSLIDLRKDEIDSFIEEFKLLWLESLRVDNEDLYLHYKEFLQLDFQKVKYDENENFDLGKTVAEVSKYSMKFNDLFGKTETLEEKAQVLSVLADELRNVRNISYGGVIADIARELNVEAEVKADVHTNDDEQGRESGICKICKAKTVRTKYQFFTKYNKYYKTYDERLQNVYSTDKTRQYLIDKETGEIVSDLPFLSYNEETDNYITKQRIWSKITKKNNNKEEEKKIVGGIQLKLFR